MENKHLRLRKKHIFLKTVSVCVLALASTCCFAITAKPSTVPTEAIAMSNATLAPSDEEKAQIDKYINQALAIIKRIPKVGSMKQIELIADVDRIADRLSDQYREVNIEECLRGQARYMTGNLKDAYPYFKSLLARLQSYWIFHYEVFTKNDLEYVEVPICIFGGDYYLYEEKDYEKAIYYYKHCVDKDGKLISGIEERIEQAKKALEAGPSAK